MSNYLPYFLLLLCSLAWGTSFACVKIGLTAMTAMELALARLLVSSVAFILVLLYLKSTKQSISIARQHWPDIFLLGFIGITAMLPLQAYAVRLTYTIHASLIMAVSPIICAAYLHFTGAERVQKRGLLGFLIAFTGVVLIILSSNKATGTASNMLLGDALMLLTCLGWAFFTIRGRTLMSTYPPFIVVAYIFLVGTLLLALLSCFYFAALPSTFTWSQLTLEATVAILLLGLFASVYCYYVWYRCIKQLGAVRTSIFMYMNPLFASLAGVFYLNEQLTPALAAGFICVLSGVYLLNKK